MFKPCLFSLKRTIISLRKKKKKKIKKEREKKKEEGIESLRGLIFDQLHEI